MDVKRFFKRIFLFSIPFLFIIPVVEYGLSTMPNSYNKKKKSMEAQLGDIQVLVTGNSHSAYGIDPTYFSIKGFNAANVAQSLYYDRAITSQYLSKMTHLKQVIIPISYGSLYYLLSDSPEDWRGYFYERIWHIKIRIRKPLDFLEYTYIKMYYPNTASYALRFFKDDLAPNLMSNGFMKRDTVFTGFLDSTGANIFTAYFKSGKHAINHEENLSDLESLVSDLRNKNIKVSFITIPVMKEYMQYCDTSFLNQNHICINAFCRKYSCTYHDYLTDGRFVKSDFSDYSHLNYLGAAKFSKILNQDIITNASQ